MARKGGTSRHENSSDSYGARGAFPIPEGIDIGDLGADPESGEQYIMRVRLEAKGIPKITVAEDREEFWNSTEGRSTHLPSQDQHSKSKFAPSEEWLSKFPGMFKGARRSLLEQTAHLDIPEDFVLPDLDQQKKWRTLCYQTCDESNMVMLYTLADMDQNTAIHLIRLLTNWISKDRLLRVEGIWLWYLLLKIDNPLEHNETHVLRTLCRKLCSIRRCFEQRDCNLVLNSGDHIASINILITAVTRWYGQRDLEDE